MTTPTYRVEAREFGIDYNGAHSYAANLSRKERDTVVRVYSSEAGLIDCYRNGVSRMEQAADPKPISGAEIGMRF